MIPASRESSSETNVSDHAEYQEDAAMVTILTIGYRARCTAPGCGNLARTILRHADRSGWPLSNLERCNHHAREALGRATKAG
jgi:hypothetical protein